MIGGDWNQTVPRSREDFEDMGQCVTARLTLPFGSLPDDLGKSRVVPAASGELLRQPPRPSRGQPSSAARRAKQ